MGVDGAALPQDSWDCKETVTAVPGSGAGVPRARGRQALPLGRRAQGPLAAAPYPAPPSAGAGPPPRASQQRENLRELMFILVTPMSLSGAERLKEAARGASQKRSACSSRSSSS